MAQKPTERTPADILRVARVAKEQDRRALVLASLAGQQDRRQGRMADHYCQGPWQVTCSGEVTAPIALAVEERRSVRISTDLNGASETPGQEADGWGNRPIVDRAPRPAYPVPGPADLPTLAGMARAMRLTDSVKLAGLGSILDKLVDDRHAPTDKSGRSLPNHETDNWVRWQGADLTAAPVLVPMLGLVGTVWTEQDIVHRVPGSRPGSRKPRMEHVAWCEATKCLEHHNCHKAGHNDWSCPAHGTEQVRGHLIPAALDQDNGTADQTSRGQVIQQGRRPSVLARHRGKRGQQVRPEPSEPVMSDYAWDARLAPNVSASVTRTDNSDIVVTVNILGAVLTFRAAVLLAGPEQVTNGGGMSDSGKVLVYGWSVLNRPHAVLNRPDREGMGWLRENEYLLSVRNQDGTRAKVRPTRTATATLVARDAHVSDILDKQVPKRTKPAEATAAAVASASTADLLRRRLASL